MCDKRKEEECSDWKIFWDTQAREKKKFEDELDAFRKAEEEKEFCSNCKAVEKQQKEEETLASQLKDKCEKLKTAVCDTVNNGLKKCLENPGLRDEAMHAYLVVTPAVQKVKKVSSGVPSGDSVVEQAKDKATEGLDKVQDKTKEVSEAVQDKTKEVSSKVEKKTKEAKENISNINADQIKDKAKEVKEETSYWFSNTAAKVVEPDDSKFQGNFSLIKSENFDEFMKEVGTGFITRKLGAVVKPVTEITKDDTTDDWRIKTITSFKSTDIKFKLGVPFVEETADGRKCNTTITKHGLQIIQDQKCDGRNSIIVREFNGDEMTMILTAGDVVAKRVYRRT